MVIHAVRTGAEREIALLLLRRLAERGDRTASLVWDRGMLDPVLDLAALGPSREIEAINRWRLPQRLARIGLVPVARLARNLRVRWWWQRLGRPDSVLLLGPLRDEMRNYLPPGNRPVGAVLGARPLEPAESLAGTLEVVDVAVAVDASTVAACAEARPETRVLTFPQLLTPSGAPPGGGRHADHPLVVGVGPGDWRGAPDLFLRAAAHLRRLPERSTTTFGWIGVDPADERSFPYRFDAGRLDLDGDVTWTDQPATAIELLRRADVVVLTARSTFPLPVHPWVSTLDPAAFLAAVGTPVVGFATPAVTALAGAATATVPYPDTEALARAVDAALDTTTPSRVPHLLDEVLAAVGVDGAR